MDTPCPMVASTLSSVTARGELMVLMVPLFSAAESRRFSCAAPPALPRTKPMPPPLLRPIGAGMFTAKFGTLTPLRPPSGAAGSSAAAGARRGRRSVGGAGRLDDVGEHEAGRVSGGGSEADVAAPLDADLTGEAGRRFDDAALDEHFRG